MTSSSGPSCPLSRYRTELRACSATEKIRPADGQRLPSAYPTAFAAILTKDWLPPLFTGLPAIKHARQEFAVFRYFGQSSALYASIRDFTADRLKSSRKRASPPRRDITLLRAPPRGIPGYSLFSGGRLFAGDRDCALARVPSALHCIFCFLKHSVIHSRVSRRALAQGILCAFPQCDTSQKGFHPLYTLSCRIARRNSSFFL